MGGGYGSGGTTDSVEILVAGEWRSSYPLPQAREEIYFVTLGNYVLLTGGSSGSSRYSSIYQIQCDADADCVDWTFTGSHFSNARHTHVAMMVPTSAVSCF